MDDSNDFSDFDINDFAPDVRLQEVKHKTKAKTSEPFPIDGIDLESPPGFVGEVSKWIDSQCRYPRRNLCVATAILTVGNIGGLRHEDAHCNVTSNMLAFCVAASATGKEAVQQAMMNLHSAAGLGGAIQGAIKSEQEVSRNLLEHQATFYVIDEIGIFLGKVRNAQKRGGAAYLEGVFGIIMSAYSKANGRMLLGGDAKRDLRKLYGAALSVAADEGNAEAVARAERMLAMVDNGLERPFLSIVGYTTPSTFDGIMDGETATQGFIGRSIIVTESEINPAYRKGFKPSPIPDHIISRLSMLFTGGAFDSMSRASARIEFSGSRELITTTPEAAEMLELVLDWLHDYADEMEQNTGEASVAMIRRAYEMVAKVSFILAIPHGERTAEHVRWAFAYCRAELDVKIALVFANDNSREKPVEAMAARVQNYLTGSKGMTLSVLANRMKAKPPELESVLRKMESRGLIREQTCPRKYAGKNVTQWVISD